MLEINLKQLIKQTNGEFEEKFAAKNLNLICASEILVRTRKTTPMKELNDEERRKNVERAFLVKENVVKYKKILLVDDIYTTGSTAEAVTAALKQLGIREVYVFCIAIGKGFS